MGAGACAGLRGAPFRTRAGAPGVRLQGLPWPARHPTSSCAPPALKATSVPSAPSHRLPQGCCKQPRRLTQHALVVGAQVRVLAGAAPGEHLTNELQRARRAAREHQLRGAAAEAAHRGARRVGVCGELHGTEAAPCRPSAGGGTRAGAPGATGTHPSAPPYCEPPLKASTISKCSTQTLQAEQRALPPAHLVLPGVGPKQRHQLAAHRLHLARRTHAGWCHGMRIAVRILAQLLWVALGKAGGAASKLGLQLHTWLSRLAAWWDAAPAAPARQSSPPLRRSHPSPVPAPRSGSQSRARCQ